MLQNQQLASIELFDILDVSEIRFCNGLGGKHFKVAEFCAELNGRPQTELVSQLEFFGFSKPALLDTLANLGLHAALLGEHGVIYTREIDEDGKSEEITVIFAQEKTLSKACGTYQSVGNLL